MGDLRGSRSTVCDILRHSRAADVSAKRYGERNSRQCCQSLFLSDHETVQRSCLQHGQPAAVVRSAVMPHGVRLHPHIGRVVEIEPSRGRRQLGSDVNSSTAEQRQRDESTQRRDIDDEESHENISTRLCDNGLQQQQQCQQELCIDTEPNELVTDGIDHTGTGYVIR